MWHGCLLQFADDACLICASGSPASVVARMLQDDLCVLSKWVTLSIMKLNPSLMQCDLVLSILQPLYHQWCSTLLCYRLSRSKNIWVQFLIYAYLNWSCYVASVCRSMSYYLSLINYHVKSIQIIKMLMESLVFPLYLCLIFMEPAIH